MADGDGIRFIHQAIRRRTLSLSFRIGGLLPAERTAPGPLLATEWCEEDWTRWRERQVLDPEDFGFPATRLGRTAPSPRTSKHGSNVRVCTAGPWTTS